MEKIKVNIKDLSEFLKLTSEFGASINNPYVVDAAQTLHDHFFGEEPITTPLEEYTKGNIQFVK